MGLITRSRSNAPEKNNTRLYIILTVIVIVVASFAITISLMAQDNSPNPDIWGDAPDFTLKTVDGEDFTLSDHQGKIIILDLMAAWCTWCDDQMEILEDILDEKGDQILIVSIDVQIGETREDLESVFGKWMDKWIFVFDNERENVGYVYQAYSIPQVVVIDQNGNLYYINSGLTSKSTLLEKINGLLEN